MKLFVTGGAGFIGSNFIHFMVREHPDYEIVNFDLLTYAGNLANLEDLPQTAQYSFIRGDITDRALLYEVTKGNDVIVHFAAESHVDRSIASSEAFLKTNIIGTGALLDAARANKIPRFHHISTDEVFGQLGATGVFNERTPYAPRNPYSASKAGADHVVRSYFHTYGLPITISNCSNNFGPRQFPEKFIPLAITNLLQGKKIPVYGTGTNMRDWLYVDDHCRAIDRILQRGVIGETYCVGGGTEMHNIDIARSIVHALGYDDDKIEFVQDRQGHDYRYAIDAQRIMRELKWRPEADFAKHLQVTIEWYKDHAEWWNNILSGAYRTVSERIPVQGGVV